MTRGDVVRSLALKASNGDHDSWLVLADVLEAEPEHWQRVVKMMFARWPNAGWRMWVKWPVMARCRVRFLASEESIARMHLALGEEFQAAYARQAEAASMWSRLAPR